MDKRGIDVSSWQGVIDWDAVKSSGVEFAILRSSFGSPSPSQVDNQFYNNVKRSPGRRDSHWRLSLRLCGD